MIKNLIISSSRERIQKRENTEKPSEIKNNSSAVLTYPVACLVGYGLVAVCEARTLEKGP